LVTKDKVSSMVNDGTSYSSQTPAVTGISGTIHRHSFALAYANSKQKRNVFLAST